MRTGLISALALSTMMAIGCGGNDSSGDSAEQTRFPRLTHAQWENTVQDLFGLSAPPDLASAFDADPPLGRFDNNVARLQVTAGLWQDYQRAAETMAERVTADSEAMARIVPGDLPSDPEGQARGFVASFGARVFRRPLEDSEIDRYAALFAQGAALYESSDVLTSGVRITIEAMLQSPHFIYRIESSSKAEDGVIALSGYEIASRLSYLFWNSMPDDALFAAAASGELDSLEGVEQQAQRLFDDPRTRASFGQFHTQLFSLREYADLDKDLDAFPQWRRELGDMMQTETRLFLESLVFDRAGTIGDLLTSPHSFVNDDLAQLYGLSGEFNSEFTEVALDPDTRGGLLTQLGFLTRNATRTESDPIHRGVFINLDILCRPINAVPDLPDDLMPVGNTNRERIDSITGLGTCGAGCHGYIINPLGFALENYDGIGQYRTEDNGFPVDATGTYVFEDGREIVFDGAIELGRLLAEAPEVHSCYVDNLIEYAFGRDVEAGDEAMLEELVKLSLEEGASIREVLMTIVTHRAFRSRTPGK